MWQSSDAVTSSWESGEKHSERIGMAWPAQTKAPLLASLGWNCSFSSAKWNLLTAECQGTAKLHPATEICLERSTRKMCSTCIPVHADSGLQIIQFQVHTYVSANFCAYAEPKVKTPNGLKTHQKKKIQIFPTAGFFGWLIKTFYETPNGLKTHQKKVQIFPSAGFFSWLIEIFYNRSTFLAWSLSSSGHGLVGSLFSNEEEEEKKEKKVGLWQVWYCSHTGLTREVTDTDFWTKNGSLFSNEEEEEKKKKKVGLWLVWYFSHTGLTHEVQTSGPKMVHFSAMKKRKKRRRKKVGLWQVWYFSHTGLTHEVTDTDFWAKNGSTHGHVLVTFKLQFLTNTTRNQSQTAVCPIFHSIFINRVHDAALLPFNTLIQIWCVTVTSCLMGYQLIRGEKSQVWNMPIAGVEHAYCFPSQTDQSQGNRGCFLRSRLFHAFQSWLYGEHHEKYAGQGCQWNLPLPSNVWMSFPVVMSKTLTMPSSAPDAMYLPSGLCNAQVEDQNAVGGRTVS